MRSLTLSAIFLILSCGSAFASSGKTPSSYNPQKATASHSAKITQQTGTYRPIPETNRPYSSNAQHANGNARHNRAAR